MLRRWRPGLSRWRPGSPRWRPGHATVFAGIVNDSNRDERERPGMNRGCHWGKSGYTVAKSLKPVCPGGVPVHAGGVPVKLRFVPE